MPWEGAGVYFVKIRIQKLYFIQQTKSLQRTSAMNFLCLNCTLLTERVDFFFFCQKQSPWAYIAPVLYKLQSCLHTCTPSDEQGSWNVH